LDGLLITETETDTGICSAFVEIVAVGSDFAFEISALPSDANGRVAAAYPVLSRRKLADAGVLITSVYCADIIIAAVGIDLAKLSAANPVDADANLPWVVRAAV
jgi:hypothetical protein